MSDALTVFCFSGIIVGALALALVLWCCLVVSGDISENEERMTGERQS